MARWEGSPIRPRTSLTPFAGPGASNEQGADGKSRAVPPLPRQHLDYVSPRISRISQNSRTPRSGALTRTDANTKSGAKSTPKSLSTTRVEQGRGWAGSVVFATIAVAVVLAIAVVANLAIGRIIHWDIVTVLGVIGFTFLVVGRKYKTI